MTHSCVLSRRREALAIRQQMFPDTFWTKVSDFLLIKINVQPSWSSIGSDRYFLKNAIFQGRWRDCLNTEPEIQNIILKSGDVVVVRFELMVYAENPEWSVVNSLVTVGANHNDSGISSGILIMSFRFIKVYI